MVFAVSIAFIIRYVKKHAKDSKEDMESVGMENVIVLQKIKVRDKIGSGNSSYSPFVTLPRFLWRSLQWSVGRARFNTEDSSCTQRYEFCTPN